MAYGGNHANVEFYGYIGQQKLDFKDIWENNKNWSKLYIYGGASDLIHEDHF